MIRRLAAGVVTAAAILLLAAGPVAAHASLVAASPQNGARLDAAPTKVSLEFDEPVAEPAFVVVTAPDGAQVQEGPAVVRDATVSQTLQPGLGGGSYKVAYRVVSADGHPVSATLTFSVVGVGTSPSSSAAAPASDDRPLGGHLALVAVAVVIVVAGVAGILLDRRRAAHDGRGEPAGEPDDADARPGGLGKGRRSR